MEKLCRAISTTPRHVLPKKWRVQRSRLSRAIAHAPSSSQANTVYRLGNWEYSHQFRDAPESAQYSALRYGAWMLELKGHLQAKMGKSLKVPPPPRLCPRHA